MWLSVIFFFIVTRSVFKVTFWLIIRNHLLNHENLVVVVVPELCLLDDNHLNSPEMQYDFLFI